MCDPLALRVIEELGWRVLLDDLSLVHEDHAISDRAREAHLVRHVEHSDALVRGLGHNVQYFLDHFPIEHGEVWEVILAAETRSPPAGG